MNYIKKFKGKKIAFYDNMCNNAYIWCKILRKQGVNAELLFDDRGDKKSYPEWMDPEIEDSYPEWIKTYKNIKTHPWEATKIIRDASKYDVIWTEGIGPMLMQFQKTPYVFFSYGSDMSILPFFKSLRVYTDFFFKMSFFLQIPLQRRGIKKSSRIIALPHQLGYMEKLGVKDKYEYVHWPNPEVEIDENYLSKLREKYGKYKRIYFSPTRHFYYSDKPSDYKGNDKIIEAFSEVCGDKNAILVLLNSGPDVEASKELISQLQIEDKVEWIDLLPNEKLAAFFKLGNTVHVEHLGWVKDIGACAREGLMQGCPLIAPFDQQELYEGEVPIIDVRNKKNMKTEMLRIYNMPEKEFKKLRLKSKKFVNKHHGGENQVNKYLKVLWRAMNEKNE